MSPRSSRLPSPAKLLAAVAVPLLLIGCSGAAEEAAPAERDLGTPVVGEVPADALAGSTLAFAGSGGVLQDAQTAAVWTPFAEQSGATVNQDAFDSGKLKAMVDSGNPQWDVVLTGSLDSAQGCGTLYAPIDTSKIDFSQVPEGSVVNECMAPAIAYGTVLAYNTDAFGANPPTRLEDFFDTEKFPGKRSVNMSTWPSGEVMEWGLAVQGIDGADLQPDDIARGLDPFRELGDDLIGWTTGAQAQQQLEAGEAVMSIVWTGRGYGAELAGAPVAAMWDDWYIMNDALAVPTGTKDPDAAFAMINYYLGADQQTELSELTAYGPTNVNAAPQLDAVADSWLSTNHLDTGRNSNEAFWVENYDALTEAWAGFVTGS